MKARLEKMAQALKNAGAKEVYIYGSAATDTMRENSDFDVGVSGLPPELFFDAFGAALDAAGRSIDFTNLDENTAFTRHLKAEPVLKRLI